MNKKQSLTGILLLIWILSPTGCRTQFQATRLSGTLDNRFSKMFSSLLVPIKVGVMVPRDVQRHILEAQAQFQGAEDLQKKAPWYRYGVGQALRMMMQPASRIVFDSAVEVSSPDEARTKGCQGILTVDIVENKLNIVFLHHKSPTATADQPGYTLANIKGQTQLNLKLTFYDLGYREIWKGTAKGESFQTFPPEATKDPYIFNGIVEESIQQAVEFAITAMKSATPIYEYGQGGR